ncbi:hypothetical protein NEIFLAOT_01070 [Neisseria flavescens NRL30031/H210]|uniref:Uncharacterized protein n=1 Tax=Neisseria flavescens NRL30031/H210 TaxID=546264 RepID=C0EMA0_NEIFL|nr:hypothetical protein NEIFLAOT_01070 [Neisseria flavescens NRL30031/H210]
MVAHGNNHRKAINQAILNLNYNEINSYYYLFNIRKAFCCSDGLVALV